MFFRSASTFLPLSRPEQTFPCLLRAFIVLSAVDSDFYT